MHDLCDEDTQEYSLHKGVKHNLFYKMWYKKVAEKTLDDDFVLSVLD